MNNSISQVKKNYFYSTVYQVLLDLYPFITTPYLARVFGTAGVGAYTMVHTTANYFLQTAMMGMATYGNRQIAYVRDDSIKLRTVYLESYGAQLIYCFIALFGYLFLVLLPRSAFLLGKNASSIQQIGLSDAKTL